MYSEQKLVTYNRTKFLRKSSILATCRRLHSSLHFVSSVDSLITRTRIIVNGVLTVCRDEGKNNGYSRCLMLWQRRTERKVMLQWRRTIHDAAGQSQTHLPMEADKLRRFDNRDFFLMPLFEPVHGSTRGLNSNFIDMAKGEGRRSGYNVPHARHEMRRVKTHGNGTTVSGRRVTFDTFATLTGDDGGGKKEISKGEAERRGHFRRHRPSALGRPR